MAPDDEPSGSRMQQKSLKQPAKDGCSMVDGPTSLEAKRSDSKPGENDRDLPGSTRPVPDSSDSQKQRTNRPSTRQKSKQYKTPKDAAKENITMLGDPVRLKAECSGSEPTPNDPGAASSMPAEEAPQQKQIKSKI